MDFKGGHFNDYVTDGRTHFGKYFLVGVRVSERVREVGAYVSEIRKWDGHVFSCERELLAPIPLTWAREPNEVLRVDLRPEFERQFNFVFNQSHNPQVLFGTDSYEPSGVPYGLALGRYEVDVVVDAEDDVPSAAETFEVDVDKRWDRLNVGVSGQPMPAIETHPFARSARFGVYGGGTLPTDTAREQQLIDEVGEDY